MTSEQFKSHSAPFGEAIPAGTPHAVSVSLPTLTDVARLFEKQDESAWGQLETIYPRFGDHPYVQQAIQHSGIKAGRSVVALSSPSAAERLLGLMPAGSLTNTAIK